MARIKVNSKKAQAELTRRLKDTLKDKKLLNDIGLTAVKNSVASVRLGKDPSTGKDIAPFSGRSPDSYIERRRFIAKKKGSGSNFRAKKSNLTLTGQLLNSIKHFVKGNRIELRATGKHRPYTPDGKSVDNSDLAKWHTEGAGSLKKRRVIGINKKTVQIIQAKVRSFIRRSITNARR